MKGHIGDVNAVGISPSSDVVVTGGQDGTVRLWRRSDGSEICALIGTGPDRWAVVTPEGRFDTANLDEVKGLHWMFPDDPFHPLNPEIYLRDYYEPRLLSRLLFSTDLNEFRPIRPLESLDRAVPLKPTIRISRENNSDTVTVEIDVAGDSYTLESNAAQPMHTGVYDVHLFRDGQLVREYPETKDTTPDGITGSALKQWREDKLVVDYPAKRTLTFKGIKMPHRDEGQQVEFTAYGFNDDRVKSSVGSAPTAPLTGEPHRRAFLITIGVNYYGGSGWDLRYAVKDAMTISNVLGSALGKVGYTVQPSLVTADDSQQQATKVGIQRAIERVARNASPDDLVFVFFSGHGYSGKESGFYLLPSDARPTEIKWVRLLWDDGPCNGI